MKNYELNILISALSSEEELNKIVENISSFIQKEDGLVLNSEKPLKKILAYPIKKQKEAFLLSIELCLNPEKIIELEKNIKNNPEVLRFIVSIKRPVKKRRFKRSSEKKETSKKDVSSSDVIKEDKKGKLKQIEEKLEEILNK